MLVTDMIRRGALDHGDGVAVVFGKERLSFADVDRLSTRMAGALAGALGLDPQSRVAILAENGRLNIPLDFACVKARLTRVPLNSRLAAREQRQMLEAAGAGLLIHSDLQRERARELAEAIPGLRRLRVEELLALGSDDSGLPLAAEASDIVVERERRI